MLDRVGYQWIGGLAVALLAGGCGSSSAPQLDSGPAVAPSAAAVAAVNSASDSQAPRLATTPPAANAASGASQAVASTPFSPPFPDRVDLFEPPNRARGTVHRDDEFGESVELKGFINVQGPRVVLLIDGVIAPIAEGGEKYGVQVISIDPPSVVLQRGRRRWTATLE